MELQKFFKDYMNDYKGLDIYRETVDGQYFHEWNYEVGCLLLGCKIPYLIILVLSEILVVIIIYTVFKLVVFIAPIAD